MFKDPHVSLTVKDLMIQCCDTALDGLTEKNAIEDLQGLERMEFIEIVNVMPSAGTPDKFQITSNGILRVRQKLLKPVSDFIQRDDLTKILEYLKDPVGSEIANMKTEVIAETEGKFDKTLFNNKFVNFAVNNIKPVIEFIGKIIDYAK